MNKEILGNITLYNCDCMEYMATCKDNEFDLAIVDPPYGDEKIQGGYTSGKGGGVTKQKKYNQSIWNVKKTTWLEFIDRIHETEGLDENLFRINHTEKIIEYLPTGNTITGNGFRKSSSNRKASLKGFANVTDVLIEEAQELTEIELNQLDDSLRTVKAPIKIIFCYNMPEKTHVLMKRFFDLHPVKLTDGNGIEHEGFGQVF